MPGRVNGFSLAYTATGAVVLWSGIKGWSISATFRQLLAGKTPAASTEQIGTSSAAIQGDLGTGTAIPGVTTGIPAGVSSGTAAANQAIARLLAAPYGWSAGQEWDDLVSLWDRESGWSNTAQNPSSGAFGIPQALPYTKMPKAAWPVADGGSASATSQISWGLSYIASDYGSPSAAWAHEQANGWY